MRILQVRDPGFRHALESILSRGREDQAVEGKVREILARVRREGDKALFEYAKLYDGAPLSSSSIRVSPEEVKGAYGKADSKEVEALHLATSRIMAFHQRGLSSSWMVAEEEGVILGQLCRPLERVGLYVPGGKAAYPSSVLMAALPARAAGVPHVSMCTPVGPDLMVNPYVLVAADLAGIREIYKVGGAQDIAALAFGTESIPKVDKIVGPGNIYVTAAKRLVYGQVDIDIIAGPSEILVIADYSADPALVAADLLSQAEHDEQAMALLITNSEDLAHKVLGEVKARLEGLPRREIAEAALERHGAALVVENLEQAIELANEIAPEHLELLVEDPWVWLSCIKNAGAVFLGPFSPEAVGDYLAGPSHVLPTGGTARFLSPLSVEDFLKRTSLISFSAAALKEVGEKAMVLARMEGLIAHEQALKARLGNEKDQP
ncbi:MAG: histidinol dehydrogenase [candidate division NC10 bacterium]|nr:histidinol dehydrogenase [candidate division NC10 bacterium]